MKYQDFEKHIQFHLSGHEVPIDTDLLWDKIQHRQSLTERNKNRLAWLLILLTAASGSIYLLYKNTIAPDPVEQGILAGVQTDIQHDCQENTANVIPSRQDQESGTYTNAKIHSGLTIHRLAGIAGGSVGSTEITSNIQKPANLSGQNLSPAPKEIQRADAGSPNTSASVGDFVEKKDNMGTTTALLPGLLFNPVSTQAAWAGGGHRGKRQPTGCPTFDRRAPFTFEIIPEIGYFKPLKTLSNNFSEPSEIFDLRKNHEKSLEGLQAALYGRLNLGDMPLYLQSGLYYTRTSERMNLEYSYIRRDTTYGIISITRSPTGDTVTTIYGDIIRETRVSGTSVGHHYLQTLDIPLIIGYEIPMGRFIFGLEGGLFFNIFLKSSGRLLDSPATFANVEDTGNFKSSLGLNYMVAANISTELGPGRIYLAGRYRHFPNAFSNDGVLIRQEYSQAGLHLGYIFPITRTGPKIL